MRPNWTRGIRYAMYGAAGYFAISIPVSTLGYALGFPIGLAIIVILGAISN